jgi:flagellar biosynthesis protein FlhG
MTNGANGTERARVVTVGGGKGGVGKSIVALNLAASIAQEGRRVVIADLDLGTANQHLLLGLRNPKAGLQYLLDGATSDGEECLTETGVPGLKLLAGTAGTLGDADIDHAQKIGLLRKLRALKADIVVVDVGAGVGYHALDFFDLGSRKLIVTTPEVTAVHDAYAFLKSAVLRLLHEHAESDIEAALLEPATMSTSAENVTSILARLRETRPELAEKVFSEIERFGARMVVNQVFKGDNTNVFQAVAQTMHNYLGVTVPVLGFIPASATVHTSVKSRRPLALDPGSKEAQVFRTLARAVLADLPEEDFDSGAIEEIIPQESSSAA